MRTIRHLIGQFIYHIFWICTLVTSPYVLADMLSEEDLAPWEVCGLCHGLDGNSASARFPILAGQKTGYLQNQLLAFRDKVRANDGGQMQTHVAELSEQDIRLLAVYFSQQSGLAAEKISNKTEGGKTEEAIQSTDEQPLGKLLYERSAAERASCASCHDTSDPDTPRLFGQHQSYLRKQLLDFAQGNRKNNTHVNNSVLMQLTENDITALAGYLSGQQ